MNGLSLSQAWAGIEELREQRAAAEERRQRDRVGLSVNEKGWESCDPLLVQRSEAP